MKTLRALASPMKRNGMRMWRSREILRKRLTASFGRLARHSSDMATLSKGLLGYYRSGSVTPEARSLVLDRFCQTNGRFTEILASVLRMVRPARRASAADGLLGSFSADKQKQIVESIRRDGFYVFEQRLPAEICDQIENFARATPTVVHGHSKNSDDRFIFDPSQPMGKKYSVVEGEIVRNSAMQQLMGDPAILAIAEGYLQTLPMLGDVTLWWSAVHRGSADHDAGQNFHFDFDTPPRWLMIFIYLTDVDSDNGPHIYVRGSHRAGLPENSELRGRGYVRIPDREVTAAWGEENVVELRGARGTVLAVDTMGFHKGKPLVTGHRLMGQLIYSYAHFTGAHQARVALPENLHPVLAKAAAENPRVYWKFR